MFELAIMQDWLAFGVRWLHVITAIAWIGSSFYFVALDLGLRRREGLPAGAHGEEWQVHGGGFYHIQKYLVAPEAMPEHLTWFKWESYATWLSGFALLCLVYYASADLYMIDPEVADIAPWQAIALSLLFLAGGWLFYDRLCRSRIGQSDVGLMLLLYAILVFAAWGLTQVYTGRAALLHLGAITATIMSANVFMVIIPNQKIVVADLKAGRKPDPKYGKIAKQRSTHNNYLTLPVLFFMLSGHNPLAFATGWNWVIAALVFPIGVLIRHYFNTMHSRKAPPRWTWLVAAQVFILIIWLSTALIPATEAEAARPLTAAERKFVEAPGFEAAHDIVLGRCSMCHAAEPVWPGLVSPPKGVTLETEAEIAGNAREIYLQAGVTHAMPPANRTWMEEEERLAIVRWYRGAL